MLTVTYVNFKGNKNCEIHNSIIKNHLLENRQVIFYYTLLNDRLVNKMKR